MATDPLQAQSAKAAQDRLEHCKTKLISTWPICMHVGDREPLVDAHGVPHVVRQDQLQSYKLDTALFSNVHLPAQEVFYSENTFLFNALPRTLDETAPLAARFLAQIGLSARYVRRLEFYFPSIRSEGVKTAYMDAVRSILAASPNLAHLTLRVGFPVFGQMGENPAAAVAVVDEVFEPFARHQALAEKVVSFVVPSSMFNDDRQWVDFESTRPVMQRMLDHAWTVLVSDGGTYRSYRLLPTQDGFRFERC